MINNNNIPSLSERVLLNKHFLNFVCPPNCREQRIAQINGSIFASIDELEKDPFLVENKGFLHQATKPLRVVLRVAALFAITFTVSAAGTLYHGVLTAKHFINYRREATGDGRAAEWAKTGDYAAAFFRDGNCFLNGAVHAAILVGCVYSVILAAKGLYYNITVKALDVVLNTEYKKIANIVAASLWSGMHITVLGGGFSDTLSSFLKTKSPQFLSLELRNKFGLVDANGDLLKFSEEDELKYDVARHYDSINVTLKGTVFTTFNAFIFDEEKEMLDFAIDAKVILEKNHLPPLEFSYPFNGYTIAKRLEKAFKNVNFSGNDQSLVVYNDPTPSVQDIIKDLKESQYKIDSLRDIYHNYRSKTLSHIPNMTFKFLKCFVTEEFYRNSFYSDKLEQEKFYKNLEIQPLDPVGQAIPDQENTYQFFLYHARVNKWKIVHAHYDLATFETMFGLPVNYTIDDKNAAFRKYSLALHPDHHENSKESTVLFQAFDHLYKATLEDED